jgi:hypothetical protein
MKTVPKTAAFLALTLSTLFSDTAHADEHIPTPFSELSVTEGKPSVEEANVNLITYNSSQKTFICRTGMHTEAARTYGNIAINTAQINMTMTACKKLGEGLINNSLVDQVICAPKAGDGEFLTRSTTRPNPNLGEYAQKIIAQDIAEGRYKVPAPQWRKISTP